jgi:hypothetical protein
MNILLPKSDLTLTPVVLIRRAGYSEHHDRRSNQVSYARRFTPNIFPKFHVYLKDRDTAVEISLHLDQKQASYGSGHMHSGEYDGPLVEKEMERIKQFFLAQKQHENAGEPPEKKEGFWGRLFG